MTATISISVAYDRKGHIGYQGDLPWRGQLPADMERFKQLTMGHVVIMGRKTYDSLPDKFRPLPGRTNWVVTRSSIVKGQGVLWVRDPQLIVDNLWSGEDNELFVIGGAQIYQYFLPIAHRVYATLIHAEFPGDVIFPFLGEDDWQIAEASEVFKPDGKNLHPYQFVVYERREDV